MIVLYVLVYLIVIITMLITHTTLAEGIVPLVLVTWLLSLTSVSLGIVGKIQLRKTKTCTTHAIGTYIRYIKGSREIPGDYYVFRYLTESGETEARVAAEYTELVVPDSIGETYDVWYNPNKINEYIVSKDGKLSTIQKSYEKHGKPGLIVNISCILFIVLYYTFLIRLIP